MASHGPARDQESLALAGYHAVETGSYGPPMSCGLRLLVSFVISALVLAMAVSGGLLGVELGQQVLLKHSMQRSQAPSNALQEAASSKHPALGDDGHAAKVRKAAPATNTTTTTKATTTQVTSTTRQSTTHAPATHAPTNTSTTTTKRTTSTETTTTRTTETITETSTTERTTTTKKGFENTLFCYSIMRAGGYELSLVRTQLSMGASIFACEAWRVYSDEVTWLTPGPPVRLDTTLLRVSLEAKHGRVEHILNTEMFLQAWRQAQEEQLLQRHEWSVKVDPDAVFFPARLRTRLGKHYHEPGANVYFLNCKLSFELYGALEVFSKVAMETFLDGLGRCKAELPWKTYGEDLFMRKCLDLLGVTHIRDYGMLADEYCAVRPFPCVADAVAFHPFKASETYFKCVGEAKKRDKELRLEA